MIDTIGDVLPLAAGVAISPVPVIAIILMLFSTRARTNGPAFLAGWVIGLGIAVAVVASLSDSAEISTSSDAASGVGWAKVAVGALFIAFAVRRWRSRPDPGEEPSLPGWMDAVDEFSPMKAFGLAALLSGVNPKNLGLAGAAATSVSGAGLPTGETVLVLVVFVALASVTIGVPVLYSLLGGDRARATLDGWKDWLTVNNSTVMAVVLLVLGLKVLGDGIAGA